MSLHVPWPVPLAIGVVMGVTLSPRAGPWVWGAWAAASMVVTVVWLRRRRHGSASSVPVPAWVPVVAACAVGALLGGLRVQADVRRPMVHDLTALEGQRVELSGRFDGTLLRLHGVPGTVVAVRPRAIVPRGEVRVVGTLFPTRPATVPGGFDEAAWLARRGGRHVLAVETVGAHTAPPFRTRLRNALTARLPEREAALVRALVLGERDDLGEMRASFADAGLGHVLALSGLHLGVLATVVTFLVRPLGSVAGLIVALFALAFAAWIGPSPSLVRAAMMVAVAGTVKAARLGIVPPAVTLSVAATIALLWRPSDVDDLSFRLSYLSLVGLLALGVPWSGRLLEGRKRHPWAWLLAAFATFVSATVPTVPVLAGAFGTVPILGFLSSAVAIPITTVLLPLASVAAVVGVVVPPLEGAFAPGVTVVARSLSFVAEAGARLPSLPLAPFGPVATAAWTLAWLPFVWTVRGSFAARRAAMGVAVLLAAAVAAPHAVPAPELVVLDVGQGDAILVRLPGRTEILIDAGGTPFSDFDVGERIVVPALRALDVDEIELLVTTHPDADHIEGMTSLLRDMPVARLAYGHPAPGTPLWDRLVATADAYGVPMIQVRRGQSLQLGEATVHVLHPVAEPTGNPNDDSVALRIDWRGRPWIVTLGDMSSRIEATLPLPPAEVLVAAHHGSGSSTSEETLQAIQPSIVVVSVGRNRFGHPHPEVLERIDHAGAVVRRTDVEGSVRVVPTW